MAAVIPTELDQILATLLIGVDTLLGGDALHESGAYHMIADTWSSGAKPPLIYSDSFSQKARNFSQGVLSGPSILDDSLAKKIFIKKYGLSDLPSEIRGWSAFLESDNDRANYLNLSNALDVMLKTVLSEMNASEGPSFDEKYDAATGGVTDSIEVADPSEAIELLRQTLAKAGYEVTPSRNLRETFFDWQSTQKPLAPSEVAENAHRINNILLQVMRENVFSHLPFGIEGYKRDLSDVLFDGSRFETINGVDFTGSNIYQGGEVDGKPALRGLFEYNTDHPITEVKLYHLCAHEVMGHYLNAAVQDLLWRDQQLPFISTMRTMCTPDVAFQEGWAQNIFELLYGSREAAGEIHGQDLLVSLAHSDLEDFGKHNAAIIYQREGKDIEEVKRHIAEDCVQSDAIVKKLSGAWAQHTILGPMYGPAYLVGRTKVNEAIREWGNIPIAEIGYYLKGQVDINTFQTKVQELPFIIEN